MSARELLREFAIGLALVVLVAVLPALLDRYAP